MVQADDSPSATPAAVKMSAPATAEGDDDDDDTTMTVVRATEQPHIDLAEVRGGTLGGTPTTLTVAGVDAGHAASLTWQVIAGEEAMPSQLTYQANGLYQLSFTPVVDWPHLVSVSTHERHVQGSPLLVTVEHAYQPMLYGPGLATARQHEQTQLYFDSRGTLGALRVIVMGPHSACDVYSQVNQDGIYVVNYTPVEPGEHMVHVRWRDQPIRGSPFPVNVEEEEPPEPTNETSATANVSWMDTEKKHFIVGDEIAAEVRVQQQTKSDRSYKINVVSEAPSGQTTRSEVVVPGDELRSRFEVRVKPKEAGLHTVNFLLFGQHAVGSPLQLKMTAPVDANRVRVSGPGVCHGTLHNFESTFDVDTRGAGAAQLVVRVSGPQGAFRVASERVAAPSGSGHVTQCSYRPTKTGDYAIQVLWGSEHVPGSPFLVNIFGTEQEYKRFRMAHTSDPGS